LRWLLRDLFVELYPYVLVRERRRPALGLHVLCTALRLLLTLSRALLSNVACRRGFGTLRCCITVDLHRWKAHGGFQPFRR
jgi:hypothetical protein